MIFLFYRSSFTYSIGTLLKLFHYYYWLVPYTEGNNCLRTSFASRKHGLKDSTKKQFHYKHQGGIVFLVGRNAIFLYSPSGVPSLLYDKSTLWEIPYLYTIYGFLRFCSVDFWTTAASTPEYRTRFMSWKNTRVKYWFLYNSEKPDSGSVVFEKTVEQTVV